MGEGGLLSEKVMFSLLHCPHSKSYGPSDQVLLNSICQMDKLLDSSCMPSLSLRNFSAEMDEVSYRLPKSPQRGLKRASFLQSTITVLLTGHPGTPSFPSGLQTWQRQAHVLPQPSPQRLLAILLRPLDA